MLGQFTQPSWRREGPSPGRGTHGDKGQVTLEGKYLLDTPLGIRSQGCSILVLKSGGRKGSDWVPRRELGLHLALKPASESVGQHIPWVLGGGSSILQMTK